MSLEQKKATLEFVEGMTSEPAKLYLLIYNFVKSNPRQTIYNNKPTEVRVHKTPDDFVCHACEG